MERNGKQQNTEQEEKGWNSFMEQYGTKIRNKKKKAGMERNGKNNKIRNKEKGGTEEKTRNSL